MDIVDVPRDEIACSAALLYNLVDRLPRMVPSERRFWITCAFKLNWLVINYRNRLEYYLIFVT